MCVGKSISEAISLSFRCCQVGHQFSKTIRIVGGDAGGGVTPDDFRLIRDDPDRDTDASEAVIAVSARPFPGRCPATDAI